MYFIICVYNYFADFLTTSKVTFKNHSKMVMFENNIGIILFTFFAKKYRIYLFFNMYGCFFKHLT